MSTLRLASLFQDHAVLQRDSSLPVWGWATPKAKIEAKLGESVAYAYANELGHFELVLPAMKAGGPYTMEVKDYECGQTVVVSDLLIGEVWLASGQSNMEWTMRACGETVAEDAETAKFPKLRYFRVEEEYALGHHDEAGGEWFPVDPENVMNCSAVAYSFGRALHRELDVPVGLIVSARGGTIIESWTSRSGLIRNPETTDYCRSYDIACHGPERWAKQDQVGEQYSRYPEDPGNGAFAEGWAGTDFDDVAWETMGLPNTWQSQGHEYSGVFWFRQRIAIPKDWVGESLTLSLGSIDKHDVTYVNGVEVGRVGKDLEVHHWTALRQYTVPAELVAGDELLIAIRVNSFVYDGGLRGPSNKMLLHPEGQVENAISLAGEWKYAIEHNYGLVATVSDPGHNEPNSPHMLFDNMIAPLIPYAIRGAIWYQGESNAHLGPEYSGRLKTLINDWRYLWAQGEFPFYTVQLPDYMGSEAYQENSTWAGVREAQLSTLDLPNTGVAITLGLGEADDIHPTDKMPVGERLAQCALVRDYGRDGEPFGPVLVDSRIEGSKIICTFKQLAQGLATTDGEAPAGIFIAGKDRQFMPAEVVIEDDALVCTHAAIPEPFAVRYAWADNPEAFTLCNSAGQLASPFRTDRW